MSKITLKKNKMMGGMNATLKTGQPSPKRQQIQAVKPPVSATPALPETPAKPSVSALSALPETPAKPSVSALSALPDNNIGIKTLKTYNERQNFNLINISYSNITALLNILIVYLDNVGRIAYSNNPNAEPFKIQLKENLQTLLNSINNFKINTTDHVDQSLIQPINEELDSMAAKDNISLYKDNKFIGNFNPEQMDERYFKEYTYEGILKDISNIINDKNIIFNKLLTDNIYKIIPTIGITQNKEILENNIIILIYIQLIAYKFKEISEKDETIPILGITSQNTYKISKRIHEHLFKLLQEPLK
jgi:hypothetical protein